MKKNKASSKKKGQVKKSKLRTSLRESYAQKKPILKFVLIFTLGIVLFYTVYFSDFFTRHILEHIVSGQASIASLVLNIFGFGTEASQSIVSNDQVFLDIKKGCDGIEPTFFFLLGVLLVPFPRKAKFTGLLIGLGVLSLLNIVRIIGLFLVNTYWPNAFDFLHLHGGFTLFFIFTLIVWIFWANWAIGLPKTPAYEKSIS